MIIEDPTNVEFEIYGTYYTMIESIMKDLPPLHFNEDSFQPPITKEDLPPPPSIKARFKGKLIILTHTSIVFPKDKEIPLISDLFTIYLAVDVKKFTFNYHFYLSRPDLKNHFELIPDDITLRPETVVSIVDPCPPGDTNLYGHPLRVMIANLPIGYAKINIIKGKLLTTSILIKILKDPSTTSTTSSLIHSQMSNIATLLDPSLVAKEASNLNLRLMKWNFAPDLSIPSLLSSSSLICGCGTLGTQVIRALLGWNINKISIIDSGHISYSNPTRQSLWRIEDVGLSKAECASKRILEIDPTSLPKPIHFHIPSPNDIHLSPSDIDSLFTYIEENNLIFLLTDSRESRYLPSLIASLLGKISITIAIGFDSFVVMRNGGGGGDYDLGCYFCSDPLIPKSPSMDISLDQQCTISRPGLSSIAAGLGVEMAISILQSPLSINTPPPTPFNDSEPPYIRLGTSDITIPHQIRGSLSNFEIKRMIGERSKDCCSCRRSFMNIFKEVGRKSFIEDHLIPFIRNGILKVDGDFYGANAGDNFLIEDLLNDF